MSEKTIIAEFYLNPSHAFELFSIIVQEDDHPGCDIYDVEWCKRDGLYCFHCSGAGFAAPFKVSGAYWTSIPNKVVEEKCTLCDKKARKLNRTRRLHKLPKGFDGDLLEWLRENGIESDTVYCSICKDSIPTLDTDNPCEHVFWSERDAWWSGKGYSR